MGGSLLRTSELNGALTSIANYRGTICDVRDFRYLLAKINDEDIPEVTAAREAKTSALAAIEELTKLLPWPDFELLVDLIFTQSGWRRIGEFGGTQKTVDMELVLPSTGDRAFIQVKSKTNQSQFKEYAKRYSRRDEDRMFYVYHSAKRSIVNNDSRITVIGPGRLSEMVLDAGLFDWVIQKAG